VPKSENTERIESTMKPGKVLVLVDKDARMTAGEKKERVDRYDIAEKLINFSQRPGIGC